MDIAVTSGQGVGRRQADGGGKYGTGNPTVKLKQLLLVTVLALGMGGAALIETAATATAANNGNPPGCTKKGIDGPPCGPPCGKKNGNPYPGRKCEMTVDNSNPAPGQTVSTTGEGYASNSTQDITIQSAPKHLVNAQSDVDGNFTQSVTIPCDTTPGDHTLFATGVNSDGVVQTLSVGINVTNAACVLGTQTTATNTSSNANSHANEQARGTTTSTLPFTGSAATALLLALAVGMIAAGTVAVSVARRRSHGHTPAS